MPARGYRVSGRSLVLGVLACALVARAFDAQPHPNAAYVPFVVALYVLPGWYASGRLRGPWERHAGALLAVQAVLTYVPFAIFGSHWVGGVSGLLAGLVLLLLPRRAGLVAYAALAGLELAAWGWVGLPYEPRLSAVHLVVRGVREPEPHPLRADQAGRPRRRPGRRPGRAGRDRGEPAAAGDHGAPAGLRPGPAAAGLGGPRRGPRRRGAGRRARPGAGRRTVGAGRPPRTPGAWPSTLPSVVVQPRRPASDGSGVRSRDHRRRARAVRRAVPGQHRGPGRRRPAGLGHLSGGGRRRRGRGRAPAASLLVHAGKR